MLGGEAWVAGRGRGPVCSNIREKIAVSRGELRGAVGPWSSRIGVGLRRLGEPWGLDH